MSIDKYCVYVTIYHGKAELPMFYIGSTLISKITRKHNPYKGSVLSKEYRDIWKIETKNNPDDFTVKILKTSQNRDDAFDYERYVQKYFSVVQNEMYTNKAYANDKFNMYGKKHTDDTKERMSDSHKKYNENITEEQRLERMRIRKKCSKKGMMTAWNTETKSYIRTSITDPKYMNGTYIPVGKKRTQESREKTSIALKGRVSYYDPTTNKIKYIKESDITPLNLVKGVPENRGNDMSEKFSNTSFYYNPIDGKQVRVKNESNTPDGFVKGRNNFGENGNPFSNVKVGVDIRTGQYGKEQKGTHDEVYIIPRSVKKILKFENIYTASNERMVEYLKTLDIKVTKNMLFRLKRDEITNEKIKAIDITEYTYDDNHQWI